MLYIKKLKLQNIRKHEELTMDVDDSSGTHILIGKNGDGKTSVLRSLAMGLCDQFASTQLLGKSKHPIISHGRKSGSITLELEDAGNGKRYAIHTKIHQSGNSEGISQTFKENGRALKAMDFPWNKIFVAGYGAMARTLATEDYGRYSVTEAVDGLFDYGASLQNPELTIRRAFPGGIPESIQSGLKKILGLGTKDRIKLKPNGMFLKNGGTEEIKIGAIGDGYQSTLTWILDLIHWWILHQQSVGKNGQSRGINLDKIKGIVLIDEIENHLHPEWEKRIVSSLSKTFPGVQFIMSTHSPLVLSGGTACTYDFHTQDKTIHPVTVHGWPAEHVFRDVMGLADGSRADDVNEALDRYDALFLKHLKKKETPEEKRELKRLERFIQERTPGDDASLLLNKMDGFKKFLDKTGV